MSKINCIFTYVLIAGIMFLCTSYKPIADDFIIIVRVHGADVVDKRLCIFTIYGNKQQAHVKYFYADTVDYKALRNDPNFPQEYKDGKWKSLTVAQQNLLRSRVDSLSINYRPHIEKNTSINIENCPVYFKQIDSMLHSDDSIMFMKPKAKPHTIYISEGAGYEITTEINGVRKHFGVASPNAEYYPVIFRFMNATLNFISAKR